MGAATAAASASASATVAPSASAIADASTSATAATSASAIAKGEGAFLLFIGALGASALIGAASVIFGLGMDFNLPLRIALAIGLLRRTRKRVRKQDPRKRYG